MNNPLKKIKFKILKDYTTDDVFRETQKKYDEKIRGLSDRINQLSRIIEHTSGNTINFNLDWNWVNTFYMLPDKKVYTLYIYKGASESPIILKELSDEDVDEKSYVFALEDNIARFEVTVKRVSMDVRYVFLIDYENKTYIVKSKTEIDFSKSKEIKAYYRCEAKEVVETLENKGFVVVDDDECDTTNKLWYVLKNVENE